jgi:colicin import membrane protein
VAQDSYNIIPVTLAVLLHASVFGSLFFAFDLSRSAAPPMPLAIRATLVTEDSLTTPPVVQQPEPEPEPEPEPIQPDPDEEARKQAEADKRRADALKEQQRLDDIRRKEAERKAAEDRARREREAEAERERIRAELERQRLADIEQQRQDNRLEEERLQRVAQDEIYAADAAELEAQNSTEAQVYQALIIQKVRRNWSRPATARDDLECAVAVRQVPGGEVVSAQVIKSKCNGDDIVQRSVEGAIRRASPLPQPSNPLLFLRTFQITFTIDD